MPKSSHTGEKRLMLLRNISYMKIVGINGFRSEEIPGFDLLVVAHYCFFVHLKEKVKIGFKRVVFTKEILHHKDLERFFGVFLFVVFLFCFVLE